MPLIIFLLVQSHAIAGDNPRTVTAVRTETAPRIDGLLDEDQWKLAEPATDFIQTDPDEGQPATERSEVRILYDDGALYFGCSFFDSEPRKIVARLTRRDDEIESDRASIRIDSYHDHQTGYEFTFNAAGVKVDILQYDDANREDDSWDPVWELQTKIHDRGWTAEVKIPLRILRYRSNPGDTAGNVWGINFIRYISRKQELVRWAHTPKRESGFISRFGHLVGLRDLPAPRLVELLPFVTSRQSYEPASNFALRSQRFRGLAGLDAKYGLSSNFTLDATINPDFGQVEADPAVLNLTTFETFYPEKRPFFIEGTQILRFTTFGGDFGPGMFYSRRIGRAITSNELRRAAPAGGIIEDVPQNVTILGAAKLSGKTNDGLAIGVLQAFTGEENATVIDSSGQRSERMIEPFASYSLLRLKQDVWSNSNIGFILTSVAKNDRYPAFTNGYDWNLRLLRNTYSVSGFLALSRTTNANAGRINGSAGKMEFARIAGVHWRYSFNVDFTSKQYNINDMGFFRRPNDYGMIGILTYKEDAPAKIVRNYRITLFLHERRNFDEVNLIRESRMSTALLFMNYWRMTASAGADIGRFDDRETRGNGLYARPSNFSTSTYLFSDERYTVVAKAGQRFGWSDRGMRHSATEVGVRLRPVSWMDWEFETEYQRVRSQEAWVQNLDGRPVFGDRSTDQYNFTLRNTTTFTRELTLQLYTQLFLAKGHYVSFRYLRGTSEFEAVQSGVVPSNGSDFNRQSLHTNVVLRWEYMPGSTLFLVWSQARGGFNNDYFTTFTQNVRETFRVPPANTVLLKVSYWWSL